MMWTLQGFSHKLEILYIKLYFYHKSWAWHASALTLSLVVWETREQQMSWCTNVGMKRIVALWRVGANVAILIMLFRNPQAFIAKLREHFQLPSFIVWHMWESKPSLETGIISRARDLLVWYPCLILTDLEGSSLSGLTRGRRKRAHTPSRESYETLLSNEWVVWVQGKQSLLLLICIPCPHCNDKSRMKIKQGFLLNRDC